MQLYSIDKDGNDNVHLIDSIMFSSSYATQEKLLILNEVGNSWCVVVFAAEVSSPAAAAVLVIAFWELSDFDMLVH